jgi:glycosyltransferase involved in cell wall biosynthesis
MVSSYRVVYITESIPASRNTTRYQRVSSLSTQFQLTVLCFNSNVPRQALGNTNVTCFPLTKILGKYALGQLSFMVWCMYILMHLRRIGQGPRIVITSFDLYALLVGFLTKRLLTTKWVADIYDMPDLPLETSSIESSFVLRIQRLLFLVPLYLVRKTMKMADLVLCTLDPSALSDYDIPPNRLIYLTNGVDLNAITNLPSLTPTDGKRYVVWVGHISRIRGLNLVIRAASILKDHFNEINWILVGPIPTRELEWFNHQSTSIGVATKLKLIGEVSHECALTWIAKADVCILPFPRTKATDYIYPIKLFEYMSVGKPIVASRLRGVARVIHSGYNGILVDPDDAFALAKAVETLVKDDQLRRTLGRNALASVAAYDWKNINGKVIKAMYLVLGVGEES